MKIDTWLKVGWYSVAEEIITTEELGFSDEEWSLLGDGDKEQALEKWWFENHIKIKHEVVE